MSITKEYLIEKYTNQKLKVLDIAKECNLSANTISYYLKKYQIPKIFHFRSKYNKENLIGKIFGNWTVLKEINKKNKL